MAMSLTGLVYAINAGYRMGGDVLEQLAAVVAGEPLGEQNPAALRAIAGFLESFGDNEVQDAADTAASIRSYLREENANTH